MSQSHIALQHLINKIDTADLNATEMLRELKLDPEEIDYHFYLSYSMVAASTVRLFGSGNSLNPMLSTGTIAAGFTSAGPGPTFAPAIPN